MQWLHTCSILPCLMPRCLMWRNIPGFGNKGHTYQEPKNIQNQRSVPHNLPEACKMNEPGGKCSGVPTGAGDCTWNYENAGELQLTVSQLGYAVEWCWMLVFIVGDDVPGGETNWLWRYKERVKHACLELRNFTGRQARGAFGLATAMQRIDGKCKSPKSFSLPSMAQIRRCWGWCGAGCMHGKCPSSSDIRMFLMLLDVPYLRVARCCKFKHAQWPKYQQKMTKTNST